MTNFFQQIAALQLAGTFRIVITADDKGGLTVSEMFTAACGDKAAHHIVPLSLSGTPEELDAAFFEQISAPAQQVAGLLTNMNTHLKSVEAARLASKMEQDRKAKDAKPAALPKKDTDHEFAEEKAVKKKAYDDALAQIAELNDACKYEEALALLPAVSDYPDKQRELTQLQSDLTRKLEQYRKLKLF